MTRTSALRYEFGKFGLDPEERLLLHEGSALSLAPKVFETLHLLVQHSGHVLGKEELLKKSGPTALSKKRISRRIFPSFAKF